MFGKLLHVFVGFCVVGADAALSVAPSGAASTTTKRASISSTKRIFRPVVVTFHRTSTVSSPPSSSTDAPKTVATSATGGTKASSTSTRKKPCSEAPNVPNSDITYIDSQVVVYECRTNFDLVQGTKSIYCNDDGLWSDWPICERKTTPRTTTTLSSFKLSDFLSGSTTQSTPLLISSSPSTAAAAKATVTTAKITTSTTTTTTTTTSTKAIPTSPLPGAPKICPQDTDSLPFVENGKIVFKDVALLVYECLPGFSLAGDESVSCNLDGTWGESPLCFKDRTCGLLPYVPGGIVTESNMQPDATSKINSYAVFVCNRTTTTTRVNCTTSGWTAIPDCMPKSVPRTLPTRPTPPPVPTNPPTPLCPSQRLKHLVFMFDLLLPQGVGQEDPNIDQIVQEARDGTQAVIGYLKGLNFRGQVSQLSDSGYGFFLTVLTLSGGSSVISTVLPISPYLTESAANDFGQWVSSYVTLNQDGTDDDVTNLLEVLPMVTGLNSTTLNQLSCSRGLSQVRVVYVTNAKRGVALVKAMDDSRQITAAGGKILVLSFGRDAANSRQQTVYRTRLASRPENVKYIYSLTADYLDGLLKDRDYLNFLRA